ncbi:DNA repair protein complementing XP-G cells homolog [Bradysia coprophila]|uniref:DNA repair protein complementing XP-G cells homolog n=1 Tax=Bradysia coprophila TaxID=38358 RepID=UPI00187D8150|nr:DNA repair protein complementing XP-G cells homolog [Bradysia coprophila]
MGVTGLWKLIDQAGKPVPLETLENKILAIDTSIWLHQVVKGFQDSKGGTIPYAHILGLFHRLCKLLFYKIKPIFVFDGGVPDLKQETIRKRNLNKAKLHSEADRLQGLLLSSLAKEKAIQEALGTELASQLTSPKKRVKPSDNEKEDIYKLPPIPEESVGEAIAQSSDSSFDEKSSRHYYNINLNSIDVTSKRFLDLPPDVRHEILTDLKEKRKESSWGRLHELPAQSDDFSEFQMKRLLKRRQVQMSLESAEKEMGGKCLSLAEMEAMLTDEGILNAASSSAAKAIASNENALFLHVKSLQDAMKEEKRREEEEIVKKAAPKEEKTETLEEDEDEDLQAAIQLSLLDTIPIEDQAKEVKLRPDQKKFLKNAVKDSAKDYLIEYGGFNAEEVHELVMSDEDIDGAESTFRHNDTYILKGDTKSEGEPTITLEIDDSQSEVSSDADSDFIEVPELEADMNIPLREVHTLEMNKEPDADLSKDFRHEDLRNGLEIKIQKAEVLEDDIFADIFNKDTAIEEETKIEAEGVDSEVKEERKFEAITIDSDDETEIVAKSYNENVSAVKPPVVLATIIDNLSAEISDIATINLDSLPSIDNPNDANENAANHSSTLAKPSEKNSGLDSILNQLNTEMTDILEKGIESIKEMELSTPTKSTDAPHSQLNKTVPALGVFITPTKSTGKDEPPPKVVSPFFRKKTPSPRQKRKNATDDLEEEISPKIARTLFPGTSSDVEPLELAANILRENKTTDELAAMAADVRVEKRDLELERNKQDRFGMNITERMSSDCKNLLKLFGVPYIDAPMEAESQCAFLNQIELTDGTITDDSDIWLFGGQTVYKHFFNQQKHVLEFRADNINKLYTLDRHKMIQLSILVGNDYTNGIQGIGAVTAMEILSEFSSKVESDDASEEVSLLAGLSKFKDWFRNDKTNFTRKSLRSKLKNITISDDFPNRRVVEALLKPIVDESDEKFTWGQPDAESIRELAKTTFGWTYSKTDDILLPVLKKLNEKKSQQSIKNYFKTTGQTTGEGSIDVSKRVRRAIDVMSNKLNAEDNVEKPAKEKKPRKRAQKAKSEDKPVKKKSAKSKTTSEEQQTLVVKLPGEGDDVIPQRESTIVEMDKNKQNAIELFKKSKRNLKK